MYTSAEDLCFFYGIPLSCLYPENYEKLMRNALQENKVSFWGKHLNTALTVFVDERSKCKANTKKNGHLLQPSITANHVSTNDILPVSVIFEYGEPEFLSGTKVSFLLGFIYEIFFFLQ